MQQKPPNYLSAQAKRIWTKIIETYEIEDIAALTILKTACDSFDRAEKARKQLDKEGITVTDRWGQQKSHPAASIERDARAQFLAALKALRIDWWSVD